MGSSFHVAWLNGTQSREDVQDYFDDEKDIAYMKCVDEAEELTRPGSDYEGQYDEVLQSRVTYSGSYATVSYLNFPEVVFNDSDESTSYFYDGDGELEKWSSAAAVRVKITEEESKKNGATPDDQGYVWLIYAKLAC
jgi:hypothetical protein